jgi:nucleotide-binding universal stress UspA family protein
MFKHVLVPVDLGDVDAAEKAIGLARHLARQDGARLTVLTVVPDWPEELTLRKIDWQAELDAYIAGVRDGMEIAGVVRQGGSISGRIIEAIEDLGIDLVVMASHNPRITDYLIGSNAAHVVLHCPCSVLVVR